jgi:hypothetical protein
MKLYGEIEVVGENLRLGPICPQQVAHRLVQARTQIRQEATLIINLKVQKLTRDAESCSTSP